jgi:ribosomal protein S18 acetylase RimI-like enzyme
VARMMGFRVFPASIWQLPMNGPPFPDVPYEGKTANGRPYKLTVRQTDDPGQYVFECVLDGQVVGHVYACFTKSYLQEVRRELPFDGLYMYNALVSPEFRGEGIARKMVTKAINFARTKDQGRFIYAITEKHYIASSRLLEVMGFTNARTISYVGFGSWDRYREKTLIPDEQITGSRAAGKPDR